MNVHEYQARQLLQKAGAPVPKFEVIDSADGVKAAIKAIGGGNLVVKAQVHAGGRGKAGYVILSDNADEIEKNVRRMFAEPMVSYQTGPEGVKVQKVLLAPAVDIDKEYYVGMVIDRAKGCTVIMVSKEGGVEIEEVAENHPERILKETLDPVIGLAPYQCRRLAFALGVPPGLTGKMAAVMQGLYRVHKLTRETRVFGVIASPVAHSMSPVLHNPALRKCGIDGVYLPFRVESERLGDFFQFAQQLPVEAFSVTLPHKEKVMRHLAVIDKLALDIGAVNTVFRKGNQWRGMNTDAIGVTAWFAQALAAAGIACNVIAGVHHDHLFVPIERAQAAVDVLCALERADGGVVRTSNSG